MRHFAAPEGRQYSDDLGRQFFQAPEGIGFGMQRYQRHIRFGQIMLFRDLLVAGYQDLEISPAQFQQFAIGFAVPPHLPGSPYSITRQMAIQPVS